MSTRWIGNVLVVAALVAGFAEAHAANGAEISRSRGKPDGVVVLWPRIVPATTDPVVLAAAQRLQLRLQEIAGEEVDPTRVDVRPAPERACPVNGCRGTSLSVLLGHQDGGCAALAVVGPPDGAVQRMVPIAGKFQMTDAALPFRDPPEKKVVVTEFVPCATLDQSVDVLALAHLLTGG